MTRTAEIQTCRLKPGTHDRFHERGDGAVHSVAATSNGFALWRRASNTPLMFMRRLQHAHRRRLAVATVLTALFALPACVHTSPFLDAQGHTVPGSIAMMETVRVGGIEQSIWWRGVDVRNPALVLLHGGPGASEAALFRHFNAELEQRFVVVYWEQRGAGRSYHGDIAIQSMTVAQFVRDLDEVVDLVRTRFNKDRVVLLGHSWGTVLGTLYAAQHPEKIAAYVGVAQIGNMAEQRRLSYEFALAEAIRRGEGRAVEEIGAIGPAPHSVDALLALGKWTERFGGSMRGGLSTGKLIWTALNTDEAGLVDLVKFGRGNRFSLLSLESEIASLDLSARYRSFKVPVFFLLGRHDWHVPAVDVARYFDLIDAPCKRLVWFEESAHNPPFEEPQKFNQVMTQQVLPASMQPDTVGCGAREQGR
jgi:proline iminopeptidase